MSLSKKAHEALKRAVTDNKSAAEIETALIAGPHAQAASVAALGATSNLPASNASLSTSDTYADAAVKTAIDGAVNALKTAAETRLDNAEAKIDAVIAALKTAGLMA